MTHFVGRGLGNFSNRVPFSSNAGSGVAANNGLNIYALVNMGLHFLTVIAVLLFIVYIVKHLTKHPLFLPQRSDKALELLNERFVRGEIDTEDYVTRRKVLGYKSE
ncbi:putative membrane protein (DUF2078) [Desulfosporosinus acidiphilus SJ4]|uniref:Putative membrane protein (DUF2078) n=1 Tax=Desulfosporosinus acidiphilus (strain DSM 22704 / JCM 16185 / SJ4) TaxID=646529 RepID=I4D290_DESAJ|nr:DUF2078 domain-containing protein [Desulfosporosinus acidiphilus]AFM39914.1 putative membrane protein (DUF2078) [Desulfosporosinus acidiphilus SJ4]